MENNNYIRDELMEMAPSIVQLGSKSTYTVPATYFDHLSTEILQKIQADQESQFSFSNIMPFSVPEGYFEGLPAEILAKVSNEVNLQSAQEELENLSPLLSGISKKPVLSVPEGYFETVSFAQPVAEKPVAKVVSMGKRSGVWNYAIAAVIATILCIGIFLIQGKDTVSSVAKTENSTQVKTLSEEEIVNFLKTTAPNEDVSVSGSAKENDIKKSVKQMSDEEIKQFLAEEGEADQI